jgi:hypothetical protein
MTVKSKSRSIYVVVNNGDYNKFVPEDFALSNLWLFHELVLFSFKPSDIRLVQA